MPSPVYEESHHSVAGSVSVVDIEDDNRSNSKASDDEEERKSRDKQQAKGKRAGKKQLAGEKRKKSSGSGTKLPPWTENCRWELTGEVDSSFRKFYRCLCGNV